MELTREEALRLHRQMWTEMQEALGDCPPPKHRIRFKETWCINHTPEHIPKNDCYLCEYASQIDDSCEFCPIDWGGSDCLNNKINCRYSPISKILALPERKEKKK